MNMPKSKIKTIQTEDLTMDYFQFGHGDKPLVLLPGLSVDSVMKYTDAVEEAYRVLEDEFTIYLFDRRKDLPDPYSVYDMARDTADAIRELGFDQVYLFGVSQGGMIAMDIAVKDPDMVRKLVLSSTSPCVDEVQYRIIGEWAGLAEAGDAEKLYLSFGEYVYSEDVYDQSKDLIIQAAGAVTDEDLRRFSIIAKGARGFSVLDDLDKITCPVFVIGAIDDRVLGAGASFLAAEKLRGSTDVDLYMYDGYGHAAFDFAPDYKERVLDFLIREM